MRFPVRTKENENQQLDSFSGPHTYNSRGDLLNFIFDLIVDARLVHAQFV